MTPRPSRSRRRRTVLLAAGLAAALLAAAAPAAGRRGRAATPPIAIVRLGPARIGAPGHAAAHARVAFYYAGPRETVAVTVGGPLPPRARLHPLVRREGAEVWTVQPAAVGPGGSNLAGEWIAEVRFGEPADAGARFELLVIVAAEPLPPIPLPEVMRQASTLAASAIVPVERRRGRPAVAVSAIGGSEVYGNGELIVHDKEMVDLVALDLPGESRMGVAVRPEASAAIWVMPGATDSPGAIQAFFGAGDGSEPSFHYKVSAFGAWPDQWPPAGRPLSDVEWERYRASFVAESKPVPVVRWQDRLRIEELGRVRIRPGAVVAIDRQLDVQGAAKRPLAPGESIWIICIPEQGDAWVAGRTQELTPSGHWSVKAVRLQEDAKAEAFDVLAIVSAGDPTRIQAQPGALRRWLYGVESEDRSTRVTVVARDATTAVRPRPPRKRS
jgi:hypothetical protein